jgi:hypothetical protein
MVKKAKKRLGYGPNPSNDERNSQNTFSCNNLSEHNSTGIVFPIRASASNGNWDIPLPLCSNESSRDSDYLMKEDLNSSYQSCRSDESFKTPDESNATDDDNNNNFIVNTNTIKSNNNKYNSSSSTNNNNNNNNNFIVNTNTSHHGKSSTVLQPKKRCANEMGDNWKLIPPGKKHCNNFIINTNTSSDNHVKDNGISSANNISGNGNGDYTKRFIEESAVVVPKSQNSICKVGVDSAINNTENKENINENSNGKCYDSFGDSMTTKTTNNDDDNEDASANAAPTSDVVPCILTTMNLVFPSMDIVDTFIAATSTSSGSRPTAEKRNNKDNTNKDNNNDDDNEDASANAAPTSGVVPCILTTTNLVFPSMGIVDTFIAATSTSSGSRPTAEKRKRSNDDDNYVNSPPPPSNPASNAANAADAVLNSNPPLIAQGLSPTAISGINNQEHNTLTTMEATADDSAGSTDIGRNNSNNVIDLSTAIPTNDVISEGSNKALAVLNDRRSPSSLSYSSMSEGDLDGLDDSFENMFDDNNKDYNKGNNNNNNNNDDNEDASTYAAPTSPPIAPNAPDASNAPISPPIAPNAPAASNASANAAPNPTTAPNASNAAANAAPNSDPPPAAPNASNAAANAAQNSKNPPPAAPNALNAANAPNSKNPPPAAPNVLNAAANAAPNASNAAANAAPNSKNRPPAAPNALNAANAPSPKNPPPAAPNASNAANVPNHPKNPPPAAPNASNAAANAAPNSKNRPPAAPNALNAANAPNHPKNPPPAAPNALNAAANAAPNSDPPLIKSPNASNAANTGANPNLNPNPNPPLITSPYASNAANTGANPNLNPNPNPPLITSPNASNAANTGANPNLNPNPNPPLITSPNASNAANTVANPPIAPNANAESNAANGNGNIESSVEPSPTGGLSSPLQDSLSLDDIKRKRSLESFLKRRKTYNVRYSHALSPSKSVSSGKELSFIPSPPGTSCTFPCKKPFQCTLCNDSIVVDVGGSSGGGGGGTLQDSKIPVPSSLAGSTANEPYHSDSDSFGAGFDNDNEDFNTDAANEVDGNTNEPYHSDSDSFGAGFHLADDDDKNYNNNNNNNNEHIDVHDLPKGPPLNAALNAAITVPNPNPPPPIAPAPNANASNAANVPNPPPPPIAPNANASNASNVPNPNPPPPVAPNVAPNANASNVPDPNPPPPIAPNANASNAANVQHPNPPPPIAPNANASANVPNPNHPPIAPNANAVPTPPNAAPNANAASNAAANAVSNPRRRRGRPNGKLRGASLRAGIIAKKDDTGAGAKGVAGEAQTRNCVPKSLAHILRNMAKQEGTGDHLSFRLTTERQTRSNTISSRILNSDIEPTLCKRLASLAKKGDQKGFSKPKDWIPLLKELGFEAIHMSMFQTDNGCKAALLGSQDPLLVLLSLAKKSDSGKQLVYNMSHAIAVLPNSDSRSGTCTRIIDPDRPEYPIEVSKQEVQERYLNWVEKNKLEKKATHKTKAKKSFDECLGGKHISKVINTFKIVRIKPSGP